MIAMRRTRAARTLLRALPLPVVLLAACADSHTAPTTPRDRGEIMSFARIDQRAVVVALADSLPLTIHAVSLEGTPVAGTPTVRYTSSDSTKVLVRPNGTLVPVTVTGASVPVMVAVDYKGVTAVDTTYVQVTAAREDVVALSLALPPGDSVRRGAGDLVMPATTFQLRNGDTTYGLFVRFEARSRQVRTYPGLMALSAFAEGPVWIYASATIHGVAVADSIRYEFTAPVLANGYLYSSAGTPVWSGSARVRLAPYGRIEFTNYYTTPLTLDCGNASPAVTIDAYFTESCTYPTPGVYTWTANTTPALQGSVTVR